MKTTLEMLIDELVQSWTKPSQLSRRATDCDLLKLNQPDGTSHSASELLRRPQKARGQKKRCSMSENDPCLPSVDFMDQLFAQYFGSCIF